MYLGELLSSRPVWVNNNNKTGGKNWSRIEVVIFMNRQGKSLIGGWGKWGRAVLAEKVGFTERVPRSLALGSGCLRPGYSCVLPDIQPGQKKSYHFLNVGLIEKENVKAKQNRSLGQIWLKRCHSAVDGLWDNNSQCVWSACGYQGP